MKKVSKLLVLALLFGFITGCKMREEIGFSIDKNQKLSFRFVYAMDDEMIDAMINSNSSGNETDLEETDETITETENTTDVGNGTITDEMRWDYLKESVSEDYGEDVKYERYETDGYKGFIITKELGNFEDFVTTEASERVSINDEQLNSKKLFAKTENGYKSILKLDKSSGDMSGISQYQQMGALFDLKFIMTLPNKAISNNATNVSEDGLTLTWDLLTFADENIDFEFKIDNVNNDVNKTTSSNLMIYLGIGGLIILIAIVLLIVFSKKKEISTEIKQNPNTPSNNEFLNAVQNRDDNNDEEINLNITENNTFEEVKEPSIEPIENNFENSVNDNQSENPVNNNQLENDVKVEPFDEK